jgi:hypothetical protein
MLRVGIIVDSYQVPFWVAQLLIEISSQRNVQLVVQIRNSHAGILTDKILVGLFKKIDQVLLPGKPNVLAAAKVTLPSALAEVVVSPVRDGSRISYSTDAIQEIRSYKPDLLLHFGSGNLSGEILSCCAHGVWRLHPCDTRKFLGSSSGFWEWYFKMPLTLLYLLRVTESGGEIVSSAGTRSEFPSLSRNQKALFSKGMDLIIDSLVAIANSGIPVKRIVAQPSDQPLYKNLDNWVAIKALCELAFRAVLRVTSKRFFIEQWVLFYSMGAQRFPSLDFRNYRCLLPPKDRIWADPFVVSENNRHYVFFEELFWKTNRGTINCLALDQTGGIESSRIIIDRPYHLSYPFLFQHEQKWYMVPESADNKTIDLYECTEFPFRWSHKKSLINDIQALDSTIIFHEGYYWLFCTVRKREWASSNDDLNIFYTKDLLEGDWQPHAKNPVISDPAIARPAGRLFFRDGAWHRPSQICVPRYGYGLGLNKIVVLNVNNYEEVTLAEAFPTWQKNLLGVHTLNFTEGITIIDAISKRPKWG